MSLDSIRKSIMSDAESKASAADSEASKEASQIVKEAEAKAKEILRNAQVEAEKEASRVKNEALAGAEMEANSMILQARGAAVERSLKRVINDLKDELSREYPKKIFDQSVKQFKEIAEGDIVVKTGKKNAALMKGVKYKVEYADVDGFMLYEESGKIALNATVESIAGKEMDNARRFIADELFSGRERSALAPKKAKSAPKQKKAKAAKKAKGKRR